MQMFRRRALVIALLISFVITLAGGATWLTGFLYWGYKMRATLQEAEDGITGPRRITQPEGYSWTLPPERALDSAGCRAYPYLIEALDPSRKRHFLKYCSLRLVDAVVPFMLPGHPSDEEENQHDKLRRQYEVDWEIKAVDTPEIVRSKCERIRAWWKEHGHDYHQSWRWWTNECRPTK